MWTRQRHPDLLVTRESLHHQRARTYTLVRAPGADVRARTLVLVLHGFGGTAQGMRAFSGGQFDRLAARGDTVVAYPDGVGREWNSARKAVMLRKRAKSVDDVGFLRALIERLRADHHPAQVFMVGFSLGGQMTIRMLLDAPELLDGAALISSTLPDRGNRIGADRPVVPMPVITVHGTADPLTPWGGGLVGFRRKPESDPVLFSKGPHLSAADTTRFFAARNNIDAAPEFAWIRTGPAAGWIGRTDYRQPGRPPVTGVTVVGGVHEVPGPRWRTLLPDTSVGRGLVAADLVMEFFQLVKTEGSEQEWAR